MKTKLLSLIFVLSLSFTYAQRNTIWQKQNANRNSITKSNHVNLREFQTFTLNTAALSQQLTSVPQRSSFSGLSNVIVLFPTSEGKLERFAI